MAGRRRATFVPRRALPRTLDVPLRVCRGRVRLRRDLAQHRDREGANTGGAAISSAAATRGRAHACRIEDATGARAATARPYPTARSRSNDRAGRDPQGRARTHALAHVTSARADLDSRGPRRSDRDDGIRADRARDLRAASGSSGCGRRIPRDPDALPRPLSCSGGRCLRDPHPARPRRAKNTRRLISAGSASSAAAADSRLSPRYTFDLAGL